MAYIDDRLLAIDTALDAAVNNTDIAPLLVPYGYDAAKIAEGQAIWTEADDLHAAQKVEYGEQYDATDTYDSAFKTARHDYMNTLKLARIVFKKDKAAQTALVLRGEREDSLAGWVGQASTFYKNLLANAAWLAAIAPYNRPQATLEAEQALVETLVDANAAQEKETGEAQDATRVRDAKLKELFEWHRELAEVAEVALEGNPEWIELIRGGDVQ